MPKTPPITNDSKMKRKEYEKELHKLQAELCYLQDWIKAAGTRVIVVFEGRDAAGKGGTIKAITGRVARGFSEWPHCRRPPIGKRPRCFCNATSSDFQPVAKSSSSTAAGTIAQVSRR